MSLLCDTLYGVFPYVFQDNLFHLKNIIIIGSLEMQTKTIHDQEPFQLESNPDTTRQTRTKTSIRYAREKDREKRERDRYDGNTQLL